MPGRGKVGAPPNLGAILGGRGKAPPQQQQQQPQEEEW